MGKVKNFKVELPSEFVKDKSWRDENIKAGDIEEYKHLKAEIESIPGKIQFPVELCSMLHKIQVNQKRLEERLELLYAVLKQIGRDGIVSNGESENGATDGTLQRQKDSTRIHWGETEEEQKLTLFQILEEAESRGIPLRTTEFKKVGGKYSTVVSYSYKIFGSWKDALKSYRENYRPQKEREEQASKTG